MNIFLDEHVEILSAMLKHHVEFMLIGGYAVIIHGYRRTTGDMDLWLNSTNENKEKLHKVLKELAFDEDDLTHFLSLDFSTHLVFSFGSEPKKIDFLTKLNNVEFQEANKHKITHEFDGLFVPVIHLNDLVLSKINTGRLKDKADIEELQHIQKYRDQNK